MANGRFISRSLSQSRKFSKVSNNDIRLLYCLLVPHVDAEGRHTADPFLINGLVMTYCGLSVESIEGGLSELHALGLIRLYAVDEEPYLELVDFHEHNKIRRDKETGLPSHEKPSKIPSPTDNLPNYVVTTEQLQSNSAQVEVEVEVEVQDKVQVQDNKPMSAANAAVSVENLENLNEQPPPENPECESNLSEPSKAIPEDPEKSADEQIEIYSAGPPGAREWFYAMWNEKKPARSPSLESNREVDRAIKAHVKAIGFDEFLLRTEQALRFIGKQKFHTEERPCPPITLLRHLDSYSEQGRALAENNRHGNLSEADRKALDRANHWYSAVTGGGS